MHKSKKCPVKYFLHPKPPERISYNQLREIFRRIYGEPVGEGCNRVVFRNGDYVYKIPKCDSGESDNYHETQVSAAHLARCSLLTVFRFPIVRMEYVEPVDESTTNVPEWVDGIDCLQVGYTKDGRLVAYDYGLY